MSSITSETQMSNANAAIELNHVGPIDHLTIPIPEDGGVVVLTGRNGTGKSHALKGVESIYNKSARKDLRNSDGVPSGSIEGLGVSVRLGRSNTARGELVCEALDGKIDPSQLVDPGIKDPEKADAKRLASLIRLSNIKVSAKSWAEAIGKYAEVIAIDALVSEDPVESANKIRRRLHDAALTKEKLAHSKATESATLEKSVVDVDTEAECDADLLSQAFEQASEAYAAATARVESAKAHAEQWKEAKLNLETIELTAMDLELEASKLAELRESEISLTQQIAKIEQQLSELKSNHRDVTGKLTNAVDRVELAQRQKAQIAKWKEIVAKGDADTAEDTEPLLEAKLAARQAVSHGEVVRRAKETLRKSFLLNDEANSIQDEAKKIREIARSTDHVLEQALIDAGFDTIKVHDGRLCVESDRGLEPFSDLSHGERWRMAMDLTLKGFGKGAVFPVCQEAWEALDPTNREQVHAMSKARGIVLVTACATNGELKAEVMA